MSDHWSYDPKHRDRVKEIYRSLAPNVWNVFVWNNMSDVRGDIDVADAHVLISAILLADSSIQGEQMTDPKTKNVFDREQESNETVQVTHEHKETPLFGLHRYSMRPATVEAMLFDGSNAEIDAVSSWIEREGHKDFLAPFPGDYVVKDHTGKFYVCPPEDFKRLFELES